MKVNGLLDIASAQNTSQPSKGNSKTETSFKEVLGQRSQGSANTTDFAAGSAKNGSQNTTSAGSSKSENVSKEPAATDSSKPATETQDPNEATDVQTTEDAANTETDNTTEQPTQPEEADVTEAVEEIVEEEIVDIMDEIKDDDADEEAFQMPQLVIPVYVPPEATADDSAATVGADGAPRVIQTIQQAEITVTEETTVVMEAAVIDGNDTIVATEAASVVTEENVVFTDADVIPDEELLNQVAQLAPEERSQVTEDTGALTGRSDAVEADAEQFAAQVVKEAKTAVEGQEVQQTAAPTDENDENVVQAAGAETEADTDDASHDSAPKQDTSQMSAQTQTTNDGRIDLRTAAAAPLEAEHYIQPETRQQIMTSVLDQVRTEITPDRTEFYVQLKPDYLGGLSIGLVAEDKGVVARLMTNSQQVHAALQADLNQMIQLLRDKGINVVEMEVIYNQMADSTMTDSGDGRQQGFAQNGRGGRTHGGVGEVQEDAFGVYDTISTSDALAEQGGSVEYSA